MTKDTIWQDCVSNCTRLHLIAYSFQKISGGGGMPLDPPGSLWPSPSQDLVCAGDLYATGAQRKKTGVPLCKI